ncbi:MAG: hypothetical protein KJO43_09965, partial [Phycisphaerae bacterium]|nr:hypothetical protein [Phycisphaerae bacterium]
AVMRDDATALVCNLADCYARWGDLATMAAALLGVEADVDLSSPATSRNTFTKDVARQLGVPLDRGHAGLREHLRTLMATMDLAAARSSG